MTDLRTAMKRAGVSNRDLAALTGLDGARIAGYKSGSRTLGAESAERIAEHLDGQPIGYVVANRLQAMKRAAREGDARGVINAVRSVVQTAEKAGAGDATSENLNALVEFAELYAEGKIGVEPVVEDRPRRRGWNRSGPEGSVYTPD